MRQKKFRLITGCRQTASKIPLGQGNKKRDVYSYSTPAKHSGTLRRMLERGVERIWSTYARNKTQNMLEIIKQ